MNVRNACDKLQMAKSELPAHLILCHEYFKRFSFFCTKSFLLLCRFKNYSGAFKGSCNQCSQFIHN